jgi:hypothetical protein
MSGRLGNMKRDERRRHPRVGVDATAVVVMPGAGPVRYAVDDLSVGGALLRDGPPLMTGDVIRMALYLRSRAPLLVDAELVRRKPHDASGSGYAVAFRDLTATQEDVIQDAILNELEALNAPDSEVRRRVSDDDGAVNPMEPLKRTTRGRVG